MPRIIYNSTLYIFAIEFRNLLTQIHLRIAKRAFQAYLRDSQVNLGQQIAEIDRKNVQSRVTMQAAYFRVPC
ncbi:MAG TPA: hypothetical protein VGO47_01285 [Chlamydiales bacterium]|nr:hypothetical protein [Chlamydiales bacterium]